MAKKISIIIPAYNIQNYLGKCLNSVLGQTYSNLEIIVVNDGSTDDTVSIMEKYANKDIRVKVIHKENGGVTSARLCGVEAATGDYVGFVDGDDYVEPQMFERLLNNAEQYEADVSHCGYQMVFPNGWIDYYYNTGKIIIQDKQAGLKDLISGEFVEPGLGNKIFRKHLFDKLLQENLMDTSIKINEDLLMNYYLFKEVNVSVYEDVCPYHYILRKNSAATSTINENKLIDPIRVSKRLLEDTKESLELQRYVWIKLIRQYISVAAMSYGNQKNLIEPYKKNAQRELRKLVPNLFKEKSFSKKLACMAILAAYFPALYEGLHRIYAKVTGIDKKYSLE